MITLADLQRLASSGEPFRYADTRYQVLRAWECTGYCPLEGTDRTCAGVADLQDLDDDEHMWPSAHLEGVLRVPMPTDCGEDVQ